MKWFLITVGVFAAANLWAFSGVVQTAAGEKFEGEIRLEKNAFTITGTNGAAQRIVMDQLTRLRAQPKAPPLDPEAGPESKASEEAESHTRKSLAGVELIGGSFIARRVHSADDTWIKFSDSPKEAALSTLSVARIFFQPRTPEMEVRLRPGQTGLLLKRNDFIESEFKGIARGKIKVSSVLFGLKSFDPAQVQALALRDPKPARAKYELRTRSDSCFLVNAFSMDKERLTIQDPAMAGLQIMASELAEIRRCK